MRRLRSRARRLAVGSAVVALTLTAAVGTAGAAKNIHTVWMPA
jgi:hypothetical protein